MAITLYDDYIGGTSEIGINKDPESGYAISVNGPINSDGWYGGGGNLTGIVKGWERVDSGSQTLSIGGSATDAKTYSSSFAAGDYWCIGNCNWAEGVAPSDDEDWTEFYIYGSNGTTNYVRSQSFEQNINSADGQRGFQGMIFQSYITLTSTGAIRLRFNNQVQGNNDTDPGGFGGFHSWMIFKRAT
jgi:hypothetical protein